MDIVEVAAVLGMGPGEIVAVRDTPDGVVATDRDGWDLLLAGRGVAFYGRAPRGHAVVVPTPASGGHGDGPASVLMAADQPDPDHASVRDVLTWAGDDPARARAARAAEQARAAGPRVTLVRALDLVAG